MLAFRDNLVLSADALQAHKLRAALTILGLTMGVATLITVMTLVQGANTYVEQKIANLGTSVFRLARTPFAVTDFTIIYGYSPNMAEIDTRTLIQGRYFSEPEDRHSVPVCLIGDSVVTEFFPDASPLGHVIRTSNQE